MAKCTSVSMSLFYFLVVCGVLASNVLGQCPVPEHCTCSRETVECKNVDNTVKMEEILSDLLANNADTEHLSFIDGQISALKKDQFKGFGNLLSLTFVNAVFIGSLGLHEDALSGLTKVTTFRLSMNNKGQIRDPPVGFPANFFKPLTSLKALILDGNRLATSPVQDVFNGLENLEVLDLSSNNLQMPDSDALSNLKGLKTLNLGSNGLTALSSDALRGLDRLEELILSGNPALVLTDMTFKFQSLKHLDLSSNQLSEISPSWLTPVAATLESLDLSSNRIETVRNNMFLGLESLRSLNLSSQSSGTGLKKFESSGFAGLKSLETLDLSGNDLSHLSPVPLKEVNNARLLLGDNAFFCNCEVLPIRAWIKEYSKDTKLICSSPPSQAGKNVADIDPVTGIGCKPPAFTEAQDNTEIRGAEGSTITFSCSIKERHHYPKLSYVITEGNPLPKNRSKIEFTNATDANYFTVGYTFTVQDVTKADRGKIKCKGEGVYDTVYLLMDVIYGDHGLPLWAIILIAVLVVVLIAGIIVGIVVGRKKKYRPVRRH